MLDLLGDDYISQHIYNERYKEFIDISYKSYITDGFKHILGMQERWYDRISGIEKPQETRTAEEVKTHVLNILKGGE